MPIHIRNHLSSSCRFTFGKFFCSLFPNLRCSRIHPMPITSGNATIIRVQYFSPCLYLGSKTPVLTYCFEASMPRSIFGASCSECSSVCDCALGALALYSRAGGGCELLANLHDEYFKLRCGERSNVVASRIGIVSCLFTVIEIQVLKHPSMMWLCLWRTFMEPAWLLLLA